MELQDVQSMQLCKLWLVCYGSVVTCVGVLDTTKFREMLRQSPLPNLERPKRNKRCSSSVQGMPFLLSCSLLAGFCRCTHVTNPVIGQVCFANQLIVMFLGGTTSQVQD